MLIKLRGQLKASALLHRTSAPCTTAAAQLLLSTTVASRRCFSKSCATMGDNVPPAGVDMTVAFKSPADQLRFEKFKLAEGSGVQLDIVQAEQQHPSSSSSSGNVHSWWDTVQFFKHLKSAQMGRVLLSSPSIPSTQEFMRQHTAVLPQGTVLVADQQTKGKGRGGNVWTSPPGCLMFTAFRQLTINGAQAPFINYVVCLAVVHGIKEATQQLMQGGLDVQIKWPNDIYYQGVKIGGALIHTTWAASSQQFCMLTGIGLNVSNSQPTTCLDDIINSQLLTQQQQDALPRQPQQQPVKVCKEQLLASVLNHLESCFDTFEAQGFGPLQPLYLSSWMHSNQVVELDDDVAAGQAGQGAGISHVGAEGVGRVPLTIVGLSPYGFLLAKDPLGQEYELTPDGNSLDMMQGLIKKKLH